MPPVDLLDFASADELACAVASSWLNEIAAANRVGKTHCVALSGGRIAQKLFTATVELAKARAISFQNAHFFWADERCVPPTDAESNFLSANNYLFKPLGNIGENQIHRLRGEDSPQVAVKIAEDELSRIAASNKNNRPVLDLVLLGMGEDGHVASLFPNGGSAVQNCNAPYLVVENSPKPPPTRISLSYTALAEARQVWVLAAGSGKATALRESLKPEGRPPLARVLQMRANAKIFCDLDKM